MSSEALLPRFLESRPRKPSISQFAGTGMSFQSRSFMSADGKAAGGRVGGRAARRPTAGLAPCSSLNRQAPVMGSTDGLPGRNWSTGTGAFPASGTGAAGVRNAVKPGRKNTRSRHRIMNDLRMRGCVVSPRSSVHRLGCFILFLLFNLISITSTGECRRTAGAPFFG